MSILTDLVSLLGDAFTRCEFRDRRHIPPSSPVHNYLTIALTDPERLLLVMITSQREKLATLTRFNRTENGVVWLEADALGFINKPSAINCNAPVYGTPQEIEKFVDPEVGLVISTHDVPGLIKFQVFQALQASPTIPGRVKKQIVPVQAPLGVTSPTS